MEKKQILLNVIFFVLVLPIVFLIFKLYAEKHFEKSYINYANPLNLKITKILVTEDYIEAFIYNPNNFTINLLVNLVGLKNGYGSTAVVTHGGDIGVIKTIKPNGSVPYRFPVLETDPKRVIIQYILGNTTLKVSVYYEEINLKKSGVISVKV